ncbi:MAG: hypothetical protein WAW62_04565 [Candidatus Saccharimonas aalborgensis]
MGKVVGTECVRVETPDLTEEALAKGHRALAVSDSERPSHASERQSLGYEQTPKLGSDYTAKRRYGDMTTIDNRSRDGRAHTPSAVNYDEAAQVFGLERWEVELLSNPSDSEKDFLNRWRKGEMQGPLTRAALIYDFLQSEASRREEIIGRVIDELRKLPSEELYKILDKLGGSSNG